YVMTQIPPIRLTRAGKGITFCRTRKREGRMTVSAPDLRRSNRLRWRRYANSDRTRLWIGRTSGHGSGLLVDGSPGRESPEAKANVRHHYARAGGSARMVALGRLHPCGHGEHGSVLEADLRVAGRRVGECAGRLAAPHE